MVQGIKTVSFEEAVKVVKSGDRIHIHSALPKALFRLFVPADVPES